VYSCVLDLVHSQVCAVRLTVQKCYISQLKRSVTEHEKYLETNELQCRDFHARIQNFEIARDELDHRVLDLVHSQVCAVRSTVQKCCVLGSMFAFVVLVAFACLSLLETHL
jgi:uncharacterized coiled-coil protein SlyX